jgi:long-chain acyl-CoA synthetase
VHPTSVPVCGACRGADGVDQALIAGNCYHTARQEMILQKIQEAANRYPDHIAIQMKTGDRYQRYTYRDLLKGVASVTRSLGALGIAKGDRIGLLSENRPEWMIAYLSVVTLGAVIVPLDAQLTEKEVSLLLLNSAARRS